MAIRFVGKIWCSSVAASVPFAVLGCMKYAEHQHLVGIGRVYLVNDDVGQTAYNPFMGTGYAAEMPHAWKFRQPFGGNTDAGDHLRGRSRTSIPDIIVNCSDMLPRFCGVAQLYRPHDFQSAAICSSVAKVARPSRTSRWIRATS